ncbi:hypothetical protein [Bacillus sp. V3-13]|nr:hypothetical protein [Bacillus sp. V3-13]
MDKHISTISEQDMPHQTTDGSETANKLLDFRQHREIKITKVLKD